MRISSGDVIRAAWVAFAATWLIASFTAKRTVRRQSIGSLLIDRCLLALAIALLKFHIPFAPLEWQFLPDTNLAGWIAAALTVAGIAFTIWARFYLGRNWSGHVTLKADHQLVRTGPYAIVRNPIYAGLSLAVLGVAVDIGELRGLLALATVVIAWKLRTRIEERFMIEQFGAEYERYRREVKWLIPFVW